MSNIEKKDKLTDKAFLRLITTMIFGILLCLVCLCSTTWAWFSENVSVPQNQIQAAQGNLEVKVVDSASQEVANIDAESGVDLAAGEYTVTLTLPVGSASGYCAIHYGNVVYLTDYIERNDTNAPKTLSFKLSLDATTNLRFETRWGIHSADSDIFKDLTYKVANGKIELPSGASTVNDDQTAQTTAPEQTTVAP